MSPRFWLSSMAVAGTALVSGFGLGLYATSPQKVAPTEAEFPLSDSTGEDPAYEPYAASHGESEPVAINCKGCGPTLADRRFAADMAGWDGSQDPLAQDYMAAEHSDAAYPPDEESQPPRPSVQQLPPLIERFAAGEEIAPPQAFRVARGGRGPGVPTDQASIESQ